MFRDKLKIERVFNICRFWGAARNEEEIVNLFIDGNLKYDKDLLNQHLELVPKINLILIFSLDSCLCKQKVLKN